MMDLRHNIQILARRIKGANHYLRQHGINAFLSLAKQKIFSSKQKGLFSKIDILGEYDFVRLDPIGNTISPNTLSKNTLNWVIPPPGFGSGGHLNIFRFINYLENDGFDCRVIIVGHPQPSSAKEAHNKINDWYFPLKGNVYLGMENAPPAHITIATSWQTAYYVRNFQPTTHRCYFVQDFEPYFYAHGSEYAWAQDTYRFGFHGITAGEWIRDKLSQEYAMKADSFHFSFDSDIYKPHPRKDPDIRRIFFYARPPTQRRAFELGMMVLNDVIQKLPDVKVIFAGWDVSNYEIPFEHLNVGILPHNELPELYSQCDAALVMSFSNLSLLPLELMACGTPVVSNRGPHTEWLLNDCNARLADPTVEKLSGALCDVLENPEEYNRLRNEGFKTASSTCWDTEAKKVGNILRSLDPIKGPE